MSLGYMFLNRSDFCFADSMNEVFDVQYLIGSTPIAEVGISEKNQDDIIKYLYVIREYTKMKSKGEARPVVSQCSPAGDAER